MSPLIRERESFDSPKITRKKSAAAYSPTTGTCQMSPIASPRSSKEQENRNGPSNGKRENLNHLSINKRKESTMQDNEFMVLLTKVEKSSEEFMEIMQNLSSIQALKGSKELENLIGIPHASCVFKREMQKTKELMTNVIKQKLFKKKNSGLPNKDSHTKRPHEETARSPTNREERPYHKKPMLMSH
ncbi:centromere protein R isoform 3-T4 [Dama dama]|uniref:centromere protein R isoform X3 n=1 Tax=Dama dama TaxID=30532 RepID=UPI002A35A7C8|nr:centromere protein R isoform X3 [Dama dama]XP_060977684.1 centromere protein R isoform X3 [Dama dama]